MHFGRNPGASETHPTLRPAIPFQGEEIILARHAETIAEVFPNWVERSKLDGGGLYHPFDLNVPVRMPKRLNMVQAYQSDPPLSEVGRIMAQLFARELVSRSAIPKAIFAAPTLASLQTAVDIHNYIGKDCGKICVDASLTSDRSGAPYWLSEQEIAHLKFNVDDSYNQEEIELDDRSLKSIAESMKKVLPKLSSKNGIVLVVTDALAVKMLKDLALSPKDAVGNRSEEESRKRAAQEYPAMSSTVLSSRTSKGTVHLQPSRLSMRPLTTIGECSEPNFDVNCKYKTK
ncbi:phosphoglycerate mutase family protein [Ancylostoma duodenale]|uniref:Phosphoglycerate mutase family protein n=1 Tax=Ancylostoma duodenale TaxID=51022 RepID=A0A0C2DFY6_9BILA|nr:phosphoglycerate mutase family protein [Ancylostoma duodenale]